METECTWKGCNNLAVHEQKDRDGKVWSNLCEDHHNELCYQLKNFANQTAKDVTPRSVLRAWVLAGGGAEETAKRTFGG